MLLREALGALGTAPLDALVAFYALCCTVVAGVYVDVWDLGAEAQVGGCRGCGSAFTQRRCMPRLRACWPCILAPPCPAYCLTPTNLLRIGMPLFSLSRQFWRRLEAASPSEGARWCWQVAMWTHCCTPSRYRHELNVSGACAVGHKQRLPSS